MDVTQTCRDINELSEVAQKACQLFLQKCQEAGLNVRITETYRSQERQNYLYAQGRTRAGKIVTWTLKSNHTGRMAWDICKNVAGQEYSDEAFFKKAGEIAKSLGITWGGSWTTPDTPHFEVTANWQAPVEEYVIQSQKIRLNGKEKIVNAIVQDGNNYIKLQDLRDDQIEIGYDKMPIVTVKS
jgi:peptidoglycan L-alanyl-D-glutamate endopeptidase CwlK